MDTVNLVDQLIADLEQRRDAIEQQLKLARIIRHGADKPAQRANGPVKRTGPTVIQRVTDFLTSGGNQPVTIRQIADAIGVKPNIVRATIYHERYVDRFERISRPRPNPNLVRLKIVAPTAEEQTP